MLNYIQLAKQQRPIHFGTAAIIRLEELSGRPFYDYLFSFMPADGSAATSADALEVGLGIVQRTGVGDMVNVLFAGLYGGALKEKTPFRLTKDELIDWLDDEGTNALPLLVQALGMAFDALPKPATDQAPQAPGATEQKKSSRRG